MARTSGQRSVGASRSLAAAAVKPCSAGIHRLRLPRRVPVCSMSQPRRSRRRLPDMVRTTRPPARPSRAQPRWASSARDAAASGSGSLLSIVIEYQTDVDEGCVTTPLDLVASMVLEDGSRWGESAVPEQWDDMEALLDTGGVAEAFLAPRPRQSQSRSTPGRRPSPRCSSGEVHGGDEMYAAAAGPGAGGHPGARRCGRSPNAPPSSPTAVDVQNFRRRHPPHRGHPGRDLLATWRPRGARRPGGCSWTRSATTTAPKAPRASWTRC